MGNIRISREGKILILIFLLSNLIGFAYGQGALLAVNAAGEKVYRALDNYMQESKDTDRVFKKHSEFYQKLQSLDKGLRDQEKTMQDAITGINNQLYNLDQERAQEIRDKAMNDPAKEQEINDKYSARMDDLKKAQKYLQDSLLIITETKENIKNCKGILENIRSRDDWYGNELERQTGKAQSFTKCMSSLEARIKEYSELINKANDLTSKEFSTGSSGETFSAFEIRVINELKPNMEFYIDDVKLKKDSIIDLDANNFAVRALLVEDRRNQSRKLKDTANVDVTSNTDYAFAYSSGSISSDWTVESENYEWTSVSSRTDRPLKKVIKNSGIPKVQNDLIELTFGEGTVSENITLEVDGTVNWKMTSDVAGEKEIVENGSGTLQLVISPK